MKVLWNNN